MAHRLVEIYQQNQELESSSKIAGHKAKLLINRCKEALKIIQSEFKTETHSITELKKHISEMEEYLSRNGEILAINYNLDARIDIHIVIKENNLFGKHEGWNVLYIEGKLSQYHWMRLGKSLCGLDDTSNGECGWTKIDEDTCPKCERIVFEEYVRDEIKDNKDWKTREGSSSGMGLHVEYSKGIFKLYRMLRKKNLDTYKKFVCSLDMRKQPVLGNDSQ